MQNHRETSPRDKKKQLISEGIWIFDKDSSTKQDHQQQICAYSDYNNGPESAWTSTRFWVRLWQGTRMASKKIERTYITGIICLHQNAIWRTNCLINIHEKRLQYLTKKKRQQKKIATIPSLEFTTKRRGPLQEFKKKMLLLILVIEAAHRAVHTHISSVGH